MLTTAAGAALALTFLAGCDDSAPPADNGGNQQQEDGGNQQQEDGDRDQERPDREGGGEED